MTPERLAQVKNAIWTMRGKAEAWLNKDPANAEAAAAAERVNAVLELLKAYEQLQDTHQELWQLAIRQSDYLQAYKEHIRYLTHQKTTPPDPRIMRWEACKPKVIDGPEALRQWSIARARDLYNF